MIQFFEEQSSYSFISVEFKGVKFEVQIESIAGFNTERKEAVDCILSTHFLTYKPGYDLVTLEQVKALSPTDRKEIIDLAIKKAEFRDKIWFMEEGEQHAL